ncbi:MAG: hypothetical protein U0837_12755 [Dehalococcoidia bacterium]|jgi:hypothetical protein
MTNDEIHAEIDRLIEEDRYEDALRLADQLEPISDEEFLKILREAPIDDEPVSAAQLARLDAADEAIDRLFRTLSRESRAV